MINHKAPKVCGTDRNVNGNEKKKTTTTTTTTTIVFS